MIDRQLCSSNSSESVSLLNERTMHISLHLPEKQKQQRRKRRAGYLCTHNTNTPIYQSSLLAAVRLHPA